MACPRCFGMKKGFKIYIRPLLLGRCQCFLPLTLAVLRVGGRRVGFGGGSGGGISPGRRRLAGHKRLRLAFFFLDLRRNGRLGRWRRRVELSAQVHHETQFFIRHYSH